MARAQWKGTNGDRRREVELYLRMLQKGHKISIQTYIDLRSFGLVTIYSERSFRRWLEKYQTQGRTALMLPLHKPTQKELITEIYEMVSNMHTALLKIGDML